MPKVDLPEFITHPPLSKPVTVADEYLAAILDELRGLRADLADRTAVINVTGGDPQAMAQAIVDSVRAAGIDTSTTTELREPKKPAPKAKG